MKRYFIQANEQEILVVRNPEGIYTLPEYPTDNTEEHLKEVIYIVDQIKSTNKDNQPPRVGEIKNNTPSSTIRKNRCTPIYSTTHYSWCRVLSLKEILKLHEEKKFDPHTFENGAVTF